MKRRAMAMGLALGLGCSGGDAPDNSSGFGPGPWQLPGTTGTSGEATADPSATSQPDGSDTTATTGGPPPGTSGPPPPPPGDSSDGMPPDSGTFGGDDGGMQPESGWWAHCTSMVGCDPGFACLTTDAGNDGVCTNSCSPTGNTASCGASPGGTAQPVCLSVGGDSVCALGCDDGRSCPGGMICINETDDLGPISICI